MDRNRVRIPGGCYAVAAHLYPVMTCAMKGTKSFSKKIQREKRFFLICESQTHCNLQIIGIFSPG